MFDIHMLYSPSCYGWYVFAL